MNYQIQQGMNVSDPNLQRQFNPYEMQQQMHYREQTDPNPNGKKMRLAENTAEVK